MTGRDTQDAEELDEFDEFDEEVRELFETAVADHWPVDDLVPAALSGARRANMRRRVGRIAVGSLAAAAVAFGAVMIAGASGTTSTPPGGPTEVPTLALPVTAIDPACTGPWQSAQGWDEVGSFGGGTAAEREVVCTEDLQTTRTLLPGISITPYAMNAGSDPVPGTSAPEARILQPWQYTVNQRGGSSGYFYMTYSAHRSAVCVSCQQIAPQDIPGPVPGYRLVGETSTTDNTPTIAVLVETPHNTYVSIGVSRLNGGPYTPPVDVDQLAHSGLFLAALDADLHELGDR